MSAEGVNLRSTQIFGGIDIEKPPNRGQSVQMGYLTALNKRFNRQHIHLFVRARGGCLERRKAAPAPRVQFPFEDRQR
jgi:hypothetical protein